VIAHSKVWCQISKMSANLKPKPISIWWPYETYTHYSLFGKTHNICQIPCPIWFITTFRIW